MRTPFHAIMKEYLVYFLSSISFSFFINTTSCYNISNVSFHSVTMFLCALKSSKSSKLLFLVVHNILFLTFFVNEKKHPGNYGITNKTLEVGKKATFKKYQLSGRKRLSYWHERNSQQFRKKKWKNLTESISLLIWVRKL